MQTEKRAFIITFIALLLVPLADTIHPFIWEPALVENRLPAKLPDVASILRGNGSMSVPTSKWFDDRLRPRSLLIAVKNQIDYRLFRHSDRIIIGRDGWLFEPEFYNVKAERAGDPGLQRSQRYFLRLARYLAAHNIRLVIIANPIKETIYPQFLPGDVPRLPADNAFQRLRRFLKSRREWIYVDDQDVLTTKCPDVVLFNQIDIHPTFPAGVCMARELVRRIARAEGLAESPWDHHFAFTTEMSTNGGQANFMALLDPVSEEHYVDNSPFDVGKATDQGDFARDPSSGAEWEFHTRAPYRASKLPALVLFGDSFLDWYAGAGFFTYFTDVYRIRDDGSNLTALLADLPQGTRYFVYEFIEPFVEGLTPFEVGTYRPKP
jgi:hypothetical protein